MNDTFDAIDPSTINDELPPDDAVASIAALAQAQRAAEAEVIDLTAKLQSAVARYRQLAERDLPMALSRAGVASVSTPDGAKVETVTQYDASQLRSQEGLRWVEDNDGASIIKTIITIELDRGDLEEARRLFARLRQDPAANRFKGLQLIESVHPQTLGSFVRELIRQQKDPPLDLLGVHRRTYAVVGSRPKSVDVRGFAKR